MKWETQKHVDRKALISVSREVVQTADDSREIAMKRMEADQRNADKTAKRENWQTSEANTRSEMQGRMNAEAATADANRDRAARIRLRRKRNRDK